MGWFPASYVKLLEGGGSAPAAANGGDKTAASADGTAAGGMDFSRKMNFLFTSAADPGCLSRISNPNFFRPGSEFFPARIRFFFHPGSLIRIKKESKYRYFNPENCFHALENMIRVVHPGS